MIVPFLVRNELIRGLFIGVSLSGILWGFWYTHNLKEGHDAFEQNATVFIQKSQKNISFLRQLSSQEALTLAQSEKKWTDAWEQDMRRWLYNNPMKHSIRILRCLHTQEGLGASSRHILQISVLAHNVHALQQWIPTLLEKTGANAYIRSLSYGTGPSSTPVTEIPYHITLIASSASLLASLGTPSPSPQHVYEPVLHYVLYVSPESWVIRLGSEDLKPHTLQTRGWDIERISSHHLTLKRKKDGALFSWDF